MHADRLLESQSCCAVICVAMGCACRLREIVRRLQCGQVDNVTLVDNLKYAAAVLESVSKVESMYCCLSTLSVYILSIERNFSTFLHL